MKLVTFKKPSSPEKSQVGAWVDGNKIVDLDTAADGLDMLECFAQARIASLQSYIDTVEEQLVYRTTATSASTETGGGQTGDGLSARQKWRARSAATQNAPVDDTDTVLSVADVQILAPFPHPASLRDFGVFKTHMDAAARITGKEISREWFKLPNYYRGSTSPASIAGHEAVVTWPNYTEKLDFELEWGVYIGKIGKNISIEEAPEYIAGYTIYNDMSARDIQFRHMSLALGPAKGKDFDKSNIMGPCLVTPDEIGEPYNLRMIARVNGDVWADGNTSDMYYTFAEMISFVSQSETLYPGDFLGSGTVGKGCGWELDRWIQPGDVIELEIENIGVLRNEIGEPEENPAAWKEKA